MPDESQTTQDQTGQQDGIGEADQTQPEAKEEKTGGPSDEMKMQRLERELADAKEQRDKYKSVYDKGDDDNSTNTDNGELDQERDSFYKEKAGDSVSRELATELEKLPQAIKDRVQNDPFNPAWTDPKVLEYELIGVDLNNPKEKFEAAKRAAIKSIPHFIESVAPTKAVTEDRKSIGNNPAVDQSKGNEAGRDLWDIVNNSTPEEISKLTSK